MEPPPVYDTINLDKISTDDFNLKNGAFNQTFNEGEENLTDIYSKPPSIIVHNSNSQLNTSSISFDLLNSNSNVVKTRYDVKSLTNSSLYGSKSMLPPVISINTNGAEKSKKLKSSIRSSGKKSKIRNWVFRKIFSEDDAYADGEYEKNENPDETMDTTTTTNKPNLERENWSGKFDFFLSCLGYAVGLGAVWRFPYLCYKNGGGVFLIPYGIFLFFVGIPLFFLELNLGQFTSKGPFLCWKMAPIFKGLGISMNIASFYFCCYYNMIIAYSIYFLFVSLRPTLDWAKCDPDWSSNNCTDDFGESFLVRCDQADVFRNMNGLCYNYSSNYGKSPIGWWDIKKRLEFKKPVLPSQDYFNNYVLQKSNGLEGSDSGTIVWQLALSLFIAWVLVFFCIFKGIKSSGKIVYFTSLFPYVVLIILGINGWRLEGAGKGIEFYLKPDFQKLLDVNVWFDAAVQIFFTMSVSYGGLITLASYNKFNQNTLRDAFLITLSNSLTAIFAGFVVFAYIGYLAFVTQQEVKDVVSSGSGLSFIVFPFAVTKLPGAPFWAVLFFIMMLTLGLDSQFATLETIITSITDVSPLAKKHKTVLIFVMCLCLYLLGLPYCTRSGQYWIEIMDKFSAGWAILIVGTLECVCIGWVYGAKNFRKDIELMIGKKYHPIFHWYFSICWLFITPLLLVLLVFVSLFQYESLKSDNYVFPIWANLIGWLMTIFVLFGLISWVVYCLIDVTVINKRSIKTLFQPEKDWGPLLVENKRLAIHLENLEPYHDSKRVKKQRPFINMISLPQN